MVEILVIMTTLQRDDHLAKDHWQRRRIGLFVKNGRITAHSADQRRTASRLREVGVGTRVRDDNVSRFDTPCHASDVYVDHVNRYIGRERSAALLAGSRL